MKKEFYKELGQNVSRRNAVGRVSRENMDKDETKIVGEKFLV